MLASCIFGGKTGGIHWMCQTQATPVSLPRCDMLNEKALGCKRWLDGKCSRNDRAWKRPDSSPTFSVQKANGEENEGRKKGRCGKRLSVPDGYPFPGGLLIARRWLEKSRWNEFIEADERSVGFNSSLSKLYCWPVFSPATSYFSNNSVGAFVPYFGRS